MHLDAAGRARPTISLTRDEETYLLDVRFDLADLSADARQKSLAAASSLARSLVGRGAVPRVRWRYFTDRDFNVGVSISREEQFEANGVEGSAVLRDPSFLPILHYWLHGPALPDDVISWFFVAVAHQIDLNKMTRSIRRLVREREMQTEQAAEEFFKLALEAGLDIETSWLIRNAVHRPHKPARTQQRLTASADSQPGQ